jgi:hypothetical protein
MCFEVLKIGSFGIYRHEKGISQKAIFSEILKSPNQFKSN